MLVIGLTGHIATGKSTVSSILSSPPHNLTIIDADVIARVVVEPGQPAYEAIVRHFLPTTPDLLHSPSSDPNPSTKYPTKPSINRAALGRRVFSKTEGSGEDRRKLNSIVHPAVRREILRRIFNCWVSGHWAVVLDVPLLFEAGLDVLCGVTLVVAVSDGEVQLRRLMERDKHLSEEDARGRIASQMSMAEKVERAGEVVWNDKGKEELKVEVDKFVGRYRKGRGAVWTWFLVGCWPVAVGIAGWKVLGNLWRARKWMNKEKET